MSSSPPAEQATSITPSTPAGRSPWRAVGIPTEHGGWSLTAEPVLLGLLVAWSWAGLALGLSAFLAFLARTPVKALLVDRHRHRHTDRGRWAARIAAGELTLFVLLIAVAAANAPARTWVPLILAAPLILIELYYDMLSRSRRLVPELAGAMGIGSVAAAIALAGGESSAVAAGLWCVLAARSLAAIPFVRVQLSRAKDHVVDLWHSDLAQVLAVAAVLAGYVADWVPASGVAAIVVLAVLQLVATRLSPRPAVVIGVTQTVLGLGVVIATAVGVTV